MATPSFVEAAQKKAAKEHGVAFERDVPIEAKKRGARIWGKYHNILRQLQEEIAEDRDNLQSQINDLNRQVHALLEENRILERQNEMLRLRQKFIDQGMSEKDQQFYLPGRSDLDPPAAEAI